MRVLCVNPGSRSVKLSVVDAADDAVAGEPAAPREATPETLASVDAVAYRVVRTADADVPLAAPFDAKVRARVAAAREFAPLHVQPVLDLFERWSRRLPRARHVAVFDAAFHRTMPDAAKAYGLPYDDFCAGWHKVGFHGLSHAYAAARVAVLLGDGAPRRKLVSAHLGGGASVTAIDGPAALDTSMGFTPLDGVIMETRSGSVDPGLLLAYMRRKRLTIDEMESLLSERSGLLGLAGQADMRVVLAAAASGETRARLAADAFSYRVATAAGASAVALGGIDALAFLGGIGENAPVVRAAVCARLAFLGATLDTAANASPQGDAVVSAAQSRVAVLRVQTREDWMLALAARSIS